MNSLRIGSQVGYRAERGASQKKKKKENGKDELVLSPARPSYPDRARFAQLPYFFLSKPHMEACSQAITCLLEVSVSIGFVFLNPVYRSGN